MTIADTPTKPLLPRRAGETDAETRLREAINRLGGQLIKAVDASMSLRSAPQDAQRTRHIARGHLSDFAAQAMNALAQAEERNLPND